MPDMLCVFISGRYPHPTISSGTKKSGASSGPPAPKEKTNASQRFDDVEKEYYRVIGISLFQSSL